MAKHEANSSDYVGGTDAPWYRGREISEEKRAFFRRTAQRSRTAKLKALRGDGADPVHPINKPTFDPESVMPVLGANGLSALSLFSGGGGLDLGIDRAGYQHVASYDTLDAAGARRSVATVSAGRSSPDATATCER